MEIGLLILRVTIGALFIGHGTQKLFGWLDGPGIEGTRGFYGSLGYPEPRKMAYLGGGAEALAGTLLVLGLFTPLAAAAVIGVMINAIFAVHKDNGVWVADGGYEYNAVLIAAMVTLASAGPGALALDDALGTGMDGGGVWGVLAVLIGLVAGGVLLAVRDTSPQAAASTAVQEDERQAA